MSSTLAQARTQSTAPAWQAQAELARLQQAVGEMLAAAKSLGASDAEVGVSRDLGLHVQVRLGEVETVEFNRDGGFGITVYFGQRKGAASTTDTSASALHAAVKAACDIARYTAEDPYAGLADADRMLQQIPDLDLYHDWALSPEQAIDVALRCEQAGLNSHEEVKKTDSVSVSSHQGARCYGNSRGFIGGFTSTRHSISASLIAQDGKGMQRDHWYTVARDPADMLKPEVVGKIAAQRTKARLGAQNLSTGKYPVLLVPEVARGFFGHFFGAIKGGAQYRKASFMLGARGQQVWPSWLSLAERPLVKKALASGAFDDDGLATNDHDIVRAGVLENYILGTYSARRLGLQSTANAGGLHNVDVQCANGRPDFETLLAEMGEGLVVSSVMGQGVNTVTGDYSRGANGFYVKNGKIQYPVEEITIAGHLPDLMLGLRAVGSDIEAQSSLWTGSLLIDGFTVAGNN